MTRAERIMYNDISRIAQELHNLVAVLKTTNELILERNKELAK